MLTKKFVLTLLVITTGIFSINGCSEDSPTNSGTPLNVNYNALYVVNGETNDISIIDIASNQVKATVNVGGAGHGFKDDPEDSLMWPHHININQAKNKLTIGVPGFDLSGGHGGHGEGHGKIAIINPVDGMSIHRIHLRHPNHNAIFSPNGNEIWTTLMDMEGKVFIFDASTYALKDSVAVGDMPAEVTFSYDGSMAFVCNSMSNNVTVIEPINKTIMATIPVGTNPVGAWTGSNNKMYVDNEMSQTISVIDVATMAVEETVNLGFTPGFAAYNQQLNELWVTNVDSGRVEYFHRMNNEWHPKGSISTGAGAHAIVFSNDGLRAYVTNQFGGSVTVINAENRTIITDITVGAKPNGLLLRYLN